MAIDFKIFMKGLKEDYVALESYNESTLYFCEDSGEMFLGDEPYNKGFRTYTDTLPAVPAEDTLYFNTTTGVGSYYNGSAWQVAIRATVTSITSSADDNTVPTAKAVKDYVDAEIAGVTGGSAVVKDVSLSETDTGVLDVTYGDNTVENVELTGVAVNPTYNDSTLVLTIPVVGGNPLVVNLPKDNFIHDGYYDAATEEIVLVLNDGDEEAEPPVPATEIRIPASAFIDIYTSGSGVNDTVAISVTEDNKIAATFKVDTTGALSIAADGKLTIDLTDYATVASVTALGVRVDDLEDAVDILNGASTVEGSVAKALADAKAYADSLNTAMNTRMTEVEYALTMGTF